MEQKLFQDIEAAAKEDFSTIKDIIASKHHNVAASIDDIKFRSDAHDVVTANCRYEFPEDKYEIEASINYTIEDDNICSDTGLEEAADMIIGAVTITAAEDDDNDAFVFDDTVEDEVDDDSEDIALDVPEASADEDEVEEEFEDPEDSPNIEIDNNIAGHYIAECNRCHGVFISALVESDQFVEYLSGVCPLCEKESDQYIKWVIKPVETV